MEEINQVRRLLSDQKLRPMLAGKPWLARPEVFFSEKGQARMAGAGYEVHVTYRQGAISFTASVPVHVRDFALEIIHEIGLDDGRPILVHCGDEELEGDFQRVCDGSTCLALGNIGRAKPIRGQLPLEWLVTYSGLLRDSDMFPHLVGVNFLLTASSPRAAQLVKLTNAILHIVTHELLHARYLQHSETEIAEMTMDVLAGRTEIVSMSWPDFCACSWHLDSVPSAQVEAGG